MQEMGLYLTITMLESISTCRCTIYNVIKFPRKFTGNSLVTIYCFHRNGIHVVIRAGSCWSEAVRVCCLSVAFKYEKKKNIHLNIKASCVTKTKVPTLTKIAKLYGNMFLENCLFLLFMFKNVKQFLICYAFFSYIPMFTNVLTLYL